MAGYRAHWLATIAGAGYVAVPRTAEDAADYRAQGWKVEGPFAPAEQLAGAVDALERLASAIENVQVFGVRTDKTEVAEAWKEARSTLERIGGR